MDDLIKALQIFRKYSDTKYPTGCEHDVLYVYVDPDIVAGEDIVKLKDFGFDVNDDLKDCFSSYRFGSA